MKLSLITFLTNIILISSLTCNIILPDNLLSSIGLSTPFIYKNCNQTIEEEASFAEAVILDTNTGSLSIYTPLIINEGTKPLYPPFVPDIKPTDIVGIWFGSNANVIVLENPDITCINGLPNDPFGQVAACNADNFFKKAYDAYNKNKLKIPNPGVNLYGKKCYTTRNFEIIDMDQSDNVLSQYIIYNNQVGQFSETLLSQLDPNNTKIINNGSDNRLLNIFILPALGCESFKVPDISNNNISRSAQALNELQADIYDMANTALVPLGDPMCLTNGTENINKTNLFRSIVGQPPVDNVVNASTKKYCEKIIKIGIPSLFLDQKYTLNATSPTENQNLFEFLMNRMKNTLQQLDCFNILNITKSVCFNDYLSP
jgi:hypothetical protein